MEKKIFAAVIAAGCRSDYIQRRLGNHQIFR